MSITGDSGNTDRPPEHVRQEVLDRDDHSCLVCGFPRADQDEDDRTLEIHHRKRKNEGGSHQSDNLTTMCERCHRHIHSKLDMSDLDTDLHACKAESEYDYDASPADCRIINTLESIGPATISTIAEEAGLSDGHCRRRCYAMGAVDILACGPKHRWGIVEDIDQPVSGQLPESPSKAAKAARNDVMRRMSEYGLSNAEIADIIGMNARSVPVAINRSRALSPSLPPLPDGGEEEVELSDVAQRLQTLEQRITELEG